MHRQGQTLEQADTKIVEAEPDIGIRWTCEDGRRESPIDRTIDAVGSARRQEIPRNQPNLEPPDAPHPNEVEVRSRRFGHEPLA